jgi:hypothetical protein
MGPSERHAFRLRLNGLKDGSTPSLQKSLPKDLSSTDGDQRRSKDAEPSQKKAGETAKQEQGARPISQLPKGVYQSQWATSDDVQKTAQQEQDIRPTVPAGN